jgi:hypothetical protein
MLNILMHFEIFNNRIKIYLAFNVEVGMKCNINLLVSFLLIAYFYCTKVFQILYSTHKNSMEAWRLP